jgi:hypothetical protein
MEGLLNISRKKAHICPRRFQYQSPTGMIKKVIQQGRSDFDARSVLPVREHGKIARTPLVAFFNIPMEKRPRWIPDNTCREWPFTSVIPARSRRGSIRRKRQPGLPPKASGNDRNGDGFWFCLNFPLKHERKD